jgi:hypothetical protein
MTKPCLRRKVRRTNQKRRKYSHHTTDKRARQRYVTFADDALNPTSSVVASDGVVSETRSVAELLERLPPYLAGAIWTSLSIEDKKSELKRIALELLEQALLAAEQARLAAEQRACR